MMGGAMGEHKFKDLANGDMEPRNLSTHIVKILDIYCPGNDTDGLQETALEAAYSDLAKRAANEDSFILNVVQSVNVYHRTDGPGNGSRMIVTIVAQRISREELEKQQRLQRMGGR
jgi:hypothetical protein